MAKKTADPDDSGAPRWRELLSFGELAAAIVAFAAFATVLGAIVFWIRFARADVPVVEALSVLPREAFIFTGVSAIGPVVPQLIGVGLLAVIVERITRGQPPEAREIRRDLEELRKVEGVDMGALDAMTARLDEVPVVSITPEDLTRRVKWPMTLGLLTLLTLGSGWAWVWAVNIAGALVIIFIVWRPSVALRAPAWTFLAYSLLLSFAFPVATQFDIAPKVRPVVVERANGPEVHGVLVATSAAATFVATRDDRLTVIPAREVKLIRVGRLPKQDSKGFVLGRR